VGTCDSWQRAIGTHRRWAPGSSSGLSGSSRPQRTATRPAREKPRVSREERDTWQRVAVHAQSSDRAYLVFRQQRELIRRHAGLEGRNMAREMATWGPTSSGSTADECSLTWSAATLCGF